MTNIDDIQSEFTKRLDAHREEHAARLEQERRDLRARVLKSPAISSQLDVRKLAADLAADWTPHAPAAQPEPVLRQVEITSSDLLVGKDEEFVRRFGFDKYKYDLARLHYKTEYCVSLEEYELPFVKTLDLSDARQKEVLAGIVANLKKEWEDGQREWGYCLPGISAYVNGWGFGEEFQMNPLKVLNDRQGRDQVLGTAVHEKLGHGFLAAYTAFGGVKSRLERLKAETAARFGSRQSDDPLFAMRRQQANLLFQHSVVVEEGYATWITDYMSSDTANGQGVHAKFDHEKLVEAILTLPAFLPDAAENQESLRRRYIVIFSPEPKRDQDVIDALGYLENIDPIVDAYFSQANLFGQRLRYVVGDLIAAQAEANLGTVCVPYAIHIAANITFDPSSVGLIDLKDLLGTDLRSNPDARFVALSRLDLPVKNNVAELVKQAKEKLSFAIPMELR